MNEIIEDIAVILAQQFDYEPQGKIKAVAKQCAIAAKAFFAESNVGKSDE